MRTILEKNRKTNLEPLTGCFLFRHAHGPHVGSFYINIPKNASQAIRETLHCQLNWRDYSEVESYSPPVFINGAGVLETFDKEPEGIETKSQDIKKICALRNPIYRTISVYQHILKLTDEGAKDIYPTHITENTAFYKKRQEIKEEYNDEVCIEAFNLFLEFISNGNFYHRISSPQIKFLKDKNLSEKDIDLFLIVENLQADLEKLWELMRMPFPLTLKHRNATHSEDMETLTKYVETNSEVRKKILGIYSEDADLYEQITKTKIKI